jgi:hypothetical protein
VSDVVTLARTARESLARGLNALQGDPNVPPHLVEIAEPIAQAMGALHQIERAGGGPIAPNAQAALTSLQQALAQLQAQASRHPVVTMATEAVAGALGSVHALTRAAAGAAAGSPAQNVAPPQPAAPVAVPPRPGPVPPQPIAQAPIVRPVPGVAPPRPPPPPPPPGPPPPPPPRAPPPPAPSRRPRSRKRRLELRSPHPPRRSHPRRRRYPRATPTCRRSLRSSGPTAPATSTRAYRETTSSITEACSSRRTSSRSSARACG